MSATQTGASPVAATVDRYRGLLAEDASDYTVALLALAKANASGTAGFNSPSPQDAVALSVLARWRRHAGHAAKRIGTLPADSNGKELATRWLTSLIASLDLQEQALSLIDPAAAADASRGAAAALLRTKHLQARLERKLS
ncbi:MAG: hypothetical protein ACRDPE_07815 [Solirubrobacterales bacterium]